jgi:diguanylate cyclase (GGDEF)-like protein
MALNRLVFSLQWSIETRARSSLVDLFAGIAASTMDVGNNKDQFSHGDVERIVSENEALSAMLTELRARIAMLETLADTDPLVPLPNRRAFYRAVRRAIAEVNDDAASVALLFIDLDGLKRVNDRLGHHAGDTLLRHVAGLLGDGLGSDEVAARCGGDEFAMLLNNCDEATARERACGLSKKISSKCLMIGEVEITPVVSFGLAMVRGNDTPESVIARADAAMYAYRSAR